MRQIKFRGKAVWGGKIVYGNLDYRESKYCTEYAIRGQNANSWHSPCWEVVVKPETVAQLIAIDKNGNEVYEGDKVIRIAGEDFNPEKAFPFYADFRDYGAIIDEEVIKCVR